MWFHHLNPIWKRSKNLLLYTQNRQTFAYFRKILSFTPQLEFIKENLLLASLLAYFHIGAEQGAGNHPTDEDKARKKLENVLSGKLGLELGILYEKD